LSFIAKGYGIGHLRKTVTTLQLQNILFKKTHYHQSMLHMIGPYDLNLYIIIIIIIIIKIIIIIIIILVTVVEGFF